MINKNLMVGLMVFACTMDVPAEQTAEAVPPSMLTADPHVLRPIDLSRLLLFCPNQFEQSFPTSGPAQTTWRICWREVAGNDGYSNPNGLVIGPVYFRKSPNAPFVSVLWDLRVSDYFVPYHSGSPRYYDLSAFNFQLTAVANDDCPPGVGGSLLSPHVCKEVHDRGLMWKDSGGVRRGEELVMWGAINAANCRYIQEYTFRDDGIVLARMGATGQNLPSRELEPHAHNGLWRIDMDFGGAGNNRVTHVQHSENPADPSGKANDADSLILHALGITWDERRHDELAVSNPNVKNAHGSPSAYHLVPLVTGGLTQHRETFTQNDLWVTPYNSSQFAASQLPTYVSGGPNVVNTDIVLWYKGSLHHHPRDEDGVYGSGHSWIGTAHTMWTGFALIPHNFLDCSPFYRPCP